MTPHDHDDAAQWLEGARPRTLPAAVAPVLVGTRRGGAADGFSRRPRGAGARRRARAAGRRQLRQRLQRRRPRHRRAPRRPAAPRRLGRRRAAAVLARGAGLLRRRGASPGFVLSALASWWLLLVGAVAIAAAWAYTGTSRPYGYRGLGEVSVFVFFGLVAVLGTTYVQAERLTWPALAGGVGCGALACAILVTNNLRDIPTDVDAGKRTLAVVLGDRRTRTLYPSLVVGAFAAAVVVGGRRAVARCWRCSPRRWPTRR